MKVYRNCGESKEQLEGSAIKMLNFVRGILRSVSSLGSRVPFGLDHCLFCLLDRVFVACDTVLTRADRDLTPGLRNVVPDILIFSFNWHRQ
jgi:hypothetical protein